MEKKIFKELSTRFSTIYGNLNCKSKSLIVEYLLNNHEQFYDVNEDILTKRFSNFFTYFLMKANENNTKEKKKEKKNLFESFFHQNLLENYKKDLDKKSLNRNINDYSNEFNKIRLNEDNPVLFVFDDVEAIFDYNKIKHTRNKSTYHILIDLIKILPDNVLVIFLNSNCDLNNFYPPDERDIIFNKIKKPSKSLGPIYEIDNWDIFSNNQEMNMSDVPSLKYLCSFGRPLWLSLYNILEESEEDEKYKIITNIALKKLIAFD